MQILALLFMNKLRNNYLIKYLVKFVEMVIATKTVFWFCSIPDCYLLIHIGHVRIGRFNPLINPLLGHQW